MAWYREGTIQATAGSTTINGTGTNFTDTAAGVNAGDMLIFGGVAYEIADVTSGVKLVTATALPAIPAGSSYQIVTSTSMSNQSLAKKVSAAYDRILQSIASWVTIMTGSGTITIRPYGSDTDYSGLAWPTMSALVQSAITIDSTPLTTLNQLLPSKMYFAASGATGVPTGVSGAGHVGNWRYSTTGVIQEWTSSSAISGSTARKFVRYGVVSGSNVTFGEWNEVHTSLYASAAWANILDKRTKANILSDLGITFGNQAGTYAQGNDSRLSSVDGKAGGTVSSDINVNGSVSSSGTVRSTTTGYGFTKGKEGVSGGKNLIMLGYLSDSQYSIFDVSVDPNDVYSRILTQNGSGGSFFYFGASGVGQSKSGWTTYSDKRVKTKIERISSPRDKVSQLGGYTYEKYGLKFTGVIAQEVQSVLPEAVNVSSFPTTLNDGTIVENPLTLSPGDLVGLLIEDNNGFAKRIDELEKMVATLVGQPAPTTPEPDTQGG